MATHSSVCLPGKFHGQRCLVGYSRWFTEPNLAEADLVCTARTGQRTWSPLWGPLYRAAWVSLSWHGSQISPKPPIHEIKVGTKISAFHDLAAESSQVRRGKESTCPCRRRKRCGFNPRVGKMPWSGKWQSTPVFLAGESHGQRSPVGYSPWSHRRVKHDWVTEDAWKQ